jgi:hypothetical protein
VVMPATAAHYVNPPPSRKLHLAPHIVNSQFPGHELQDINYICEIDGIEIIAGQKSTLKS